MMRAAFHFFGSLILVFTLTAQAQAQAPSNPSPVDALTAPVTENIWTVAQAYPPRPANFPRRNTKAESADAASNSSAATGNDRRSNDADARIVLKSSGKTDSKTLAAKNRAAQLAAGSRKTNVAVPSPAGYSARPQRRIAQEGAYSIDDFYVDAKSELDRSLKKVVQNRVEKNAKLANLLVISQDPWSFSMAGRGTEYTFEPKYREYTDTATLKYANQEGFSFQTYADLYDNTQFGGGLSTRVSHANLGFSMSQELFSGWGRSKFKLDEEVTILQGRGKIIGAESQYLSETLKMVDSVFGLYSSRCKKREVEKILAMAKETVRVSEVQRAARTISVRDQLRIVETAIGFERQLQSNDYDIRNYENYFTTVSPEAAALARKLGAANIDCGGEKMQNVSKVEYPKRDVAQDIIKQHPSILSLELSKEASRKQIEIYQVQRRPSLTLSTGYDKINNVDPTKPYNDYYVGVNFVYQFKGDQYDRYKQTLNEQITDLNIAQRQTQLDVSNYINSLYDQLEYQLGQIPLAQKTAELSSQLLQIIQTQQAIGQLDANSIDSAYVAYSQAVAAQRDIWATASSNALKLREIKLTTDRATAIK